MRQLSGPCLIYLALAMLPCCAESGMDGELEALDASALDGATSPRPVTPDVVAVRDAATGAISAPTSPAYEAGVAQPADAGATDAVSAARDASAPATDPFADLLDDVFGGAGDAGFSPPAQASGTWTLDDGSAPECPAEPPPIPIIGGPCLGIYFSCGWTDSSGATYTCICDWVHWLCI